MSLIRDASAQELLNSNMQQNLQLVVQVSKEYTEQLGADNIIELLESVKSYHGLYYYLGSYLAFSEDPEVRGPRKLQPDNCKQLKPGSDISRFKRACTSPGISCWLGDPP